MSLFNKALELLRQYKVEPDEDGNNLIKIPYEGVNNWISVDEKLPEATGWYLVYHSNGKMARCKFYTIPNEWWYEGLRCHKTRCTHWMPLPQPPEMN